MPDRRVIAIVLPPGYRDGTDFAKDCDVEVVGEFSETFFKKMVDEADKDAHFHQFVDRR